MNSNVSKDMRILELESNLKQIEDIMSTIMQSAIDDNDLNRTYEHNNIFAEPHGWAWKCYVLSRSRKQ